MNKLPRIIFLLVGAVMPIFIGTLHSIVHFKDLVSPEIELFLQKEFIYSGKLQPLWDAWGIASFMMGLSFIVIGLLNISTFRKLRKTDTPPLLSIIAMIVYLLGVIYVGIEFGQSAQLYGGLVGLIFILACLVLTLRSKTNNKVNSSL